MRMAPSSLPRFLPQSEALITKLRTLKVAQISKLMGVSDKIATLNHQRYQEFALPFTEDNAKQALLSFTGDVYTDIDSKHYSAADFDFAQAHLRIISGLYGCLRPLDLIQPYRLEMGTKLPIHRSKDLYQFWGDKITESLNNEEKELVVNLASQEYFGAIQSKKLQASLLTVAFKEARNGTYQVIGLFAKRARGAMTNYIIKQRITTTEGMKEFSEHGYGFNEQLSSQQEYVFTR